MKRLFCCIPPVVAVVAMLLVAACSDDTDHRYRCGDGKVDPGEECDSGELVGRTCQDFGYRGGLLNCTQNCMYDFTQCIPETCGNGVIDDGEECDGSDLHGRTCEDFGYDGGTLGCLESCRYDFSGCSGGECGNGIREAGEECDGTDFGMQSCATLGFSSGVLACTSRCTIDTAGCSSRGSVCGNGVVEPGEECDGADLGDATSCVSLGYYGGRLGCNRDCTYDRRECRAWGRCGDGKIQDGAGEQCDLLNFGGLGCRDFGYDGGTLACRADCTFDFSGCEGVLPRCGNGVVDPGEECDGTDLAGRTCESLGYHGGVLACTQGCRLDESDCRAHGRCGDGVINGGEQCDGSDLAGATCADVGALTGPLGCTGSCTYDTSLCLPDQDGDSIADQDDNCPEDFNPLQNDADGDGVGDLCDGFVSQILSQGSGFDLVTDVAMDRQGNVYLVGTHSDTVFHVGTYFENLRGMFDAFVVKLDPQGSVVWARAFGGSDMDSADAVAIDGDGRVYVGGHFSGSDFSVGQYTLLYEGGRDMFVLCFNSDGTLLWATSFGGAGDEMVGDMAGLAHGVVVAASFSSASLYIGPDSFNSQGRNDVLVFSLDASGMPMFRQAYGGAGDDVPTSVTVDSGGTIYVAGTYESTDFPMPPVGYLPQAGGTDAFVMAVDSSSGVRWVRSIRSSGDEGHPRLTLGTDGNLYVAGDFSGPMLHLGSWSVANNGGSDAFVAQFVTDGTDLSLLGYGGSGNDRIMGIAPAPGGELFIAGETDSTDLMVGSQQVSTHGDLDGWIARITPSGVERWVTSFGSGAKDRLTSLASDGTSITVTGYFDGTSLEVGSTQLTNNGIGTSDGYAASFDGNGSPRWTMGIEGWRYGDDEIADVAYLDGAIYVVGRFNDVLQFGMESLPSHGDADAFVARLTKHGQPVWVRALGGAGRDQATSIEVDPVGGSLYVAGTFEGTAVMDGTVLSSAGSSDIFLLKVDRNGTVEWITSFGSTGEDGIEDLTLDGSRLYLTGYFVQGIDFGGHGLVSSGGADAFVAAMDLDATVLWARSFGDAGWEMGRAVLLHPGAGVCMTMTFSSDEMDIDGHTFRRSGPYASDGLVLCLDPSSGAFGWGTALTNGDSNGGEIVPVSMTTDASGALYVGGYFDGMISAGSLSTTHSVGYSDAFVLRLSPSGSVEQLWTFSGQDTDWLDGMVSHDGAIYVLATCTSQFTASIPIGQVPNDGVTDLCLMRIDTRAPLVKWVKHAGGGAAEWGRALTLCGEGFLCAAGGFRSAPLTFDYGILGNSDPLSRTTDGFVWRTEW